MSTPGADRSLALMKRALQEIKELRGKVDAYERAAHEPIAVIGMGCRFPGGITGPDSLWQFLLDGGDAIEDLPASRDHLQDPGSGPRPRGSFLRDIDRFDAPFFEISAREANSMDPQQRLLLEVSWETLEHAAIRPSTLRGSRTGVYVGVMTAEYSELLRGAGDFDLHTATGSAPSVIAGRLSHFYGVHGPALIVDTACSSSLAAVHLACKSLRSGECDQAFAAGLNLLLSSRAYEAERRAGMLAPDGRCKTFDARADGIGRGEGVGVVLLRRLSDALADGNPIVAVIRGSAMNHDGRSSGLTTPSERAQERVLQEALADARVSPHQVGMIEAHGTGTSLGDPVELGALATVFGADRSSTRPLLVGAAKANFGHLEGAAGILGFIKAALVVNRGEVPPQLHIERLNPLIPWSQIPIAVPTSRRPFPNGEGPRIAGVSAFGLSGTNVHVVLAQAEAASAPSGQRANRGLHLLAFSARTPAALDAMEARLRACIRDASSDQLADICHTVNTAREQFEHRRVLLLGDQRDGEGHESLRAAADLYLRGGAVDWNQLNGGSHFERVAVPPYPFEDHRYWVTLSPSPASKPGSGLLTRIPVAIAGPARAVFQCSLDPVMRDHRVHGGAVVPATAFVDLGVQVAQQLRGDRARTIRNVSIVRPLLIAHDGDVTLQVVADDSGDGIAWQVFALDGDVWTLHAEGEIVDAAAAVAGDRALSALRADHQESIDVAGFYERCREHGLDYGPAFRSLIGLWRGSESALAQIETPASAREHASVAVGLDGCLQAIGALFATASGDAPYLPVAIEALSLGRALPPAFWCLATSREAQAGDSMRLVDVELLDAAGKLIGALHGVTLRRAEAGAFQQAVPLRVPTWSMLGAAAPSGATVDGSWVIFRSAGPEGDALASQLRAQGARCSLVMCGGGFGDLGDGVFTIDPAREDDYARVLDAIPGPLRGVVHLWNTAAPAERAEAGGHEESLATGTASALHLAKALLGRTRAAGFRFCIVTRGAHAVIAGDAPVDPWQAPVWGLSRTLLLEHPEIGCRLVDLDAAVDQSSVEALMRELRSGDREEQVAYRGNQRYGLRLSDVAGDAAVPPGIDGDGHYVVTGGLGALGLQVAEWLVARGARHLTLVGRRPAGEKAERAIAEMRAGGADIRIARADVANEADVARLLRDIAHGHTPLKGIVHAAGLLDDHAIVRTTWDSCQRVFAPKIEGAWNLHRATRGVALDFFVCFSSAASILGSPGQANYAAANEWLNAFAQHRRQLGLPALSICWGPWAGDGMAAGSAAGEYLTPLSTAVAIDALERSMAANAAQIAVLPLTARFDHEFKASSTAPRLLVELAQRRIQPAVEAGVSRATLNALASAPDRRPILTELTLRVVGEALGRPLSPADAGVSLARLGMDSLMAIEIRDGLREHAGVALSVVDILSIESVDALAGKIDERLGPPAAPAASPSAAVETWPASHGQRSLWFLHGLEPRSAAYHVAFVARVGSAIDVAALESTFNFLARRHPVLNSQFALEDGGLICRSRPNRDVSFEVIDAAGIDDGALEDRVRAAYARPFDLAAGDAPFRVTLVSRSAHDHVLLTVAHHIVHDAWSMWLLADELRHVYPALVAHRAPDLPPPTKPFAEAVAEEQARLAGPDGARLWEFWRGELAALPPAIDLPADHPRPARRTSRGATHAFEWPRALTAALRELAGSEGATLFNACLAGFQGLLHRYSSQDDLIVGVPMSGRDRPGFERTVGYFVNAVPLRSRVHASTTFRQLLGEARRRTLGAMAHQGMPLSLLIDKLALEHDPSRTPIFQTLFVFQQPQGALGLSSIDGAEATDWGGLMLSAFPGLPQQEGQFDLTLELTDHGDRVTGAWKYSLDLFEPATAQRMLEHLQNLLVAAIANPDAPLSQLPMLSAADRHTIVSEWNATDRAYHLETSLPRLLEAQAARTPDAIAVVFEAQALSYREFDRQTTNLANVLRARGVAGGDVVGVYAERSIELVIALCAIVKAGAAYCPLDPSYPADRLAYMIAAAGVRTVLTQTRFTADVDRFGIERVMLDGDLAREWRDTAVEAALPAIHPDDVAYVIYTSGSTGRPKGVMVSHRAIVNRLLWMQDEYTLTAADAVLQKTTFSFDVSVWEFFWPLMTGARLVVARPDGHRDPAYLARVIREQAVTVMHFVPSMLAAFVEEPTLSQCASLRHVICSGEALPGPLCDRFFARSSSALHNLYGPTEAAVDVTYWPCDRSAPRASIPIGYPIANIRMHILDADGQPCPAGVPGELMIGGVGLARGYCGRPDLTADRFVPDPLGANGARLYRTGDRARYLADGAIDFLGRLDHQIKLRGQRIELGEIETALAAHPAVRACAVVVAGEGSPRARLVAHLESAGGTPDEDELRAYLSARLPESMVPARFVAHQSLPLTSSGKVDRRRLPEPAFHQDSRDAASPRTRAEHTLCSIWAELLNLETVGIHDNFFALGGDSILSMQMVMRAAQAGVHVTVAQFYENQSVAALAGVSTTPALVSSAREETATRLQPTPIQSWFFEQRLRSPHHFNQSVMFEVAADVEPHLLERAVAHVIAQHDALRMVFSPEGDITVAPSAGATAFAHVDLSGLAAPRQREALEAHAATMQGSLDLESGVLVNVTLYTFGDGATGRLHVIAHHLAVDGVSWRIMLDDLRAVYRQLQRGATVPVPLPAMSYRQWSERLRDYAAGGAVQAELEFWLRQSPADLDPVFSRRSEDSRPASVRTTSLDVESTAAFLGPAQDAYRTRPDDLLLTALLEGLRDLTGRHDVRIDLEGHGRTAPIAGTDTSRTVGWFTALYPLRCELRPSADAASDLKQVKEILRAVPHYGVGYGVLRYLGDGETRSRLAAQPPSELLFNYLGRLDQGLSGDFLLRLAGEDAGPLQSPGERQAYALQVDAYVLDGRLCIRWSHDPARIAADAATALADRVLDRLQALIAHCSTPASRGLTPSDVPAARLDQAQLDRALAVLESKGIATASIADLYELSPVQEGMLYHSLTADSGSIYHQRMSVTLHGDLRVSDFRAAWQSVLDRHAALRTAFVWDDVAKPLQVVRSQVALPWEDEDWRHKTPAQQRADLDVRLAADAHRGFDLTRAPLMRCLLIRMTDDAAYFCWSHHHIILDGWSFARILQEVMALYNRPGTRELPRPGQYRDYVGWLQARPIVEGQRFWRELLNGFSSPTELGIERAVPDRTAAAGHREVVRALDASVTGELVRLARDNRVTLGVVLQAAWAALLQRYSGSEDIVFGVTVAGRPAELRDVDRTVGLFINTLPVRIQAPRRNTVRDLLAGLMEQQAKREAYTFSSLAEIQSAAGVPAGVPLFRSLVVVENYPLDIDAGNPMPGVEWREFSFAEQTNYPLTLVVFPGERMQLKLAYDAQRFTDDAVTSMLTHLSALLASMASGAERAVSELAMLDAAESRLVVDELPHGRRLVFESTPVISTHHAALHEMIAAWASRTPDAAALSWFDERSTTTQSVSYRELDRRSNQLARRLAAMGVKRGDCVGVLMERTPSLIVSLLGILKAGAAYVPCDPAYPDSRVQFMLDDTRAGVTLCDSSLRAKLSASTTQVLLMDDLASVLAGESDEPPSIACGGHDPAYVIYTSGSTGKPKGVIVTHGNVMRLFEQTDHWFSFTAGDVWTFFHSVAFDFSVWEIWGALVHGARVAIVPFAVSRSTDEFHRLLADERVTVLSQTPSAFSQLMLIDEAAAAPLALRYVVFGGEALDIRKLSPWFERHGDTQPQLVNMYGITETTVHVTYRPLRAGDGLRAESVIGVPIPDLTVYVLHQGMAPAPVGVPGELYVGGAGLAPGYRGRPSLTAERFLPDPFGKIAGSRLYKTGDRGRFLADGDAEHLGRIDQQVKLRGFRIELGEIEAALRAGNGVADAVVVLADLASGPALVGYLVASRDGARSIDVDALRAGLAVRLPEYMVPTALIVLEALPRTSNGKLDRRALPAPVAPQASTGERVVPRNEAERRVLEIWRDVLPVSEIGIHDNFFDLGGHSLLLVRVHSRLKSSFGRDFPMVTLFAHPTIHALAGFLGDPEEAIAVEAAAAAGHDRGVERSTRQDARSKQRAARERSRRPGSAPE